jgi:hypothetical protein
MPLRGMPGAFCTGIVKNQAASATELLQIGSSGDFALLDFLHSRDKSSSENFPRSAPGSQASLALPRQSRGYAASRHAGRVLHRDCEKSSIFSNGTVTNRQR